jgi:hypothetical protein
MIFKVIARQDPFPGWEDVIRPNGTHSGRFTELNADKLRGGYYTSSEVAAWLCAWAIRTPHDRILEPSCGNGIFLEAAVNRLTELRAYQPSIANNLTGIEINANEADSARARLHHHLDPGYIFTQNHSP